MNDRICGRCFVSGSGASHLPDEPEHWKKKGWWLVCALGLFSQGDVHLGVDSALRIGHEGIVEFDD